MLLNLSRPLQLRDINSLLHKSTTKELTPVTYALSALPKLLQPHLLAL